MPLFLIQFFDHPLKERNHKIYVLIKLKSDILQFTKNNNHTSFPIRDIQKQSLRRAVVVSNRKNLSIMMMVQQVSINKIAYQSIFSFAGYLLQLLQFLQLLLGFFSQALVGEVIFECDFKAAQLIDVIDRIIFYVIFTVLRLSRFRESRSLTPRTTLMLLFFNLSTSSLSRLSRFYILSILL
jgi:hypothetical protein